MRLVPRLAILVSLVVIHTLLAAQLPETAPNACTICFYGPDNLVFDLENHVFLVDSDHKAKSRILKLSENLSVMADWRPFEPGPDSGPEGLALEHDGNLLVTDNGSKRLLRLSSKGSVSACIDGSFHDLGHVAVDSRGQIFISEAGENRIRKFSHDGSPLDSWQAADPDVSREWRMPQGIAFRADGALLVEDWGNARILVLSSEGKIQQVIGKRGTGPGEFLNTAGIWVDEQSKIYVADVALHRIQVFDHNGDWLRTIANSPSQKFFREGPTSVAVDHKGNIYAADGLSVVKISAQGQLVLRRE